MHIHIYLLYSKMKFVSVFLTLLSYATVVLAAEDPKECEGMYAKK